MRSQGVQERAGGGDRIRTAHDLSSRNEELAVQVQPPVVDLLQIRSACTPMNSMPRPFPSLQEPQPQFSHRKTETNFQLTDEPMFFLSITLLFPLPMRAEDKLSLQQQKRKMIWAVVKENIFQFSRRSARSAPVSDFYRQISKNCIECTCTL